MEQVLDTEYRDSGTPAMRALERRIVAHLTGERTTDWSESTLRNPASAYTSADRLEKEKAAVFGALPILACLSGDIADPGSVRTFDVFGPPIVITRGKDGTLHAFLNMCTHRGARLVSECGRRSLMTCPFHGWSFDLEGALKGVPSRGAFAGEDLAARRLVRVPVGEWNGMVFVKLAPGEERIDVADWLGALGPELGHISLPGSRAIKSDRLDVEANWKFKADTFGEAYHFNTVHPKTFAANAVHDVITYDAFGPHYRVGFVANGYKQLVGVDEADWPVSPYRAGHFIFPNTFIFAVHKPDTGRAVTVYQIYPGDRPDRSHTTITTYRPGDSPARVADATIEDLHDYTVSVIGGEDYPVAAAGTRSLMAAPPGFEVVYGRNEVAVQDFQRHVARLVGEPID